ncbi:hypothetical protein PHYBLDRAFT_155267 [Phycomyces blakesleeanus NRRL 1555(-)]|uniref:DNA primase n=1 Tax=Phycomyces blakesleeanus (strain ATCC 8743b / DSM 1359 / FGSC 10004 / NBRC 33097 / NRRL 1555) TaxID=763407 RepID=A0A162U8Y9_PHYB8|nr:hypothetical protein PHYBLDRAFT_155267 [Phycomyces blakesleeanus NRRL 1555(-)]OAD74432.1 hypothetical protein PHYBLDRAFT_155267 [Phycomyces blakesleeanus NRRL 1555(-)]|eukprot:XP_018292472.1 hypothetical protein PHYBLDRAFT_155267 [Phycomyces blakesleeanus NRRL 1555(-)]
MSQDGNSAFLLRAFYNRFFPYKTYFQWLNYDIAPTKNFSHREFSFTLKSDIYVRYNSFMDVEEFRKEIERFQPVKIDIGAVYSVMPKNKKSVAEKAFRPVEKELVFDIDMTDYDEIRTCCSGGDICKKCWQFMTVAIKVIDTSLDEDFGFKHRLWVYSGRRGVHCWVCDDRARKLDNESRKAIVNFLEVIKGGSEQSRKVNLGNSLHPSLARSLEIIKPYFGPLILNSQGVLDTPENWNKVLNTIPDAGVRERLNEMWSTDSLSSGQAKWQDLINVLDKSSDKQIFYVRFSSCLQAIILNYCYPRLDDKVSINIGHLLKSPFCVHPKTQRVCVPIPITTCENFDPFSVPTLSSLINEFDAFSANNGPDDSERKLPDYKKTSLRPYIEFFEKFVQRLLLDAQRAKRGNPKKSLFFKNIYIYMYILS